MVDFNIELIKKNAEDKETKMLIQRNKEILSDIKQVIAYENFDIFQEMLDNYEKLINKYARYAYILGFTRAIYEEE